MFSTMYIVLGRSSPLGGGWPLTWSLPPTNQSAGRGFYEPRNFHADGGARQGSCFGGSLIPESRGRKLDPFAWRGALRKPSPANVISGESISR